MAKSQAEVMPDVKELKSRHQSLELKLDDMSRRVECLESKDLACKVYAENFAVIKEATEQVAV